ncbi:hypothetical protein CCACVL1_18010 [Corchorus capsularis]|uniref:PGG domain-containing protein n=1 Tax=Corchorus capsularis TaxID=210143 RepID=A0A1R3HNN6_COCAP|nr:hypothetical protein CCACVL1_18010 [Corchorus capsularis]
MDPNLYEAVINGDIATLQGMANSPFILQVTTQGDNILHVAAKYNLKGVVEEMIKFQSLVSLVNQKNSKGDTPLHIAARLGSLGTAEVLVNCAKNISTREIEAGEKLVRMVNMEKDTALHDAARNGHVQIAELLIKEDPELALLTNDVGESPVFIAVDKKHVQIAKLIIEVAPEFSLAGRNKMNALHAAVVRSQDEVIKLSSIMAKLQNPLNYLTNMSFKNYLNFSSFGPSTIILAAFNNLMYGDFMDFLTERCKSSLSETDEDGWTPLHYVAHLGAVDTCNLFLKYIDTSTAYMRDKAGMSLIHIAAKEGETVILQILANRYPEMWDLQDNNGQTSLHLAVVGGKLDSVKFILDNVLSHDGLINQQDNKGNTALHLAIMQIDNRKIFELLVKDNRVNKTVTNEGGLTVIDILLLNKELGYFEKNWITLTVASNGGLESLEHTINKSGRQMKPTETRKLEQPDRSDPAIDTQVKEGKQLATKKEELPGPKRPSYQQLQGIASINLLVTTLIATVSFAAGFTVPGGYRSDGPDAGMAILSMKSAFRVFVITNALAFCFSCASMFLHYFKSFVEKLDALAFYTYMTTLLTSYAITALVMAFISGTYVTLGDTPVISKTKGDPKEMDTKLYKALLTRDITFLREKANSDLPFLLQMTTQGDNILHIAAKYNLIVVEEIITFLPLVSLVNQKNAKGDTPLHVAARLGSLRTAQVLIAELLIKEDPELALLTNDVGESPVFIAVDKKHVEIAKLIMDNAPEFYLVVIRLASYLGKLQSPLNYMTNISFRHHHRLTYFGTAAVIQAALNNLNYGEKCQSSLSKTDEHGWTPLHYAVHFGAVDICKLFLRYIDSSTAYIRDNDGMSLIHIAAREGETMILQILGNRYPEMWDLQDNKGQTILHLAIARGKLDSVKCILATDLSHDGLINQQDNEGNTALHLAIMQIDNRKIFKLLIKDTRVDKTITNMEGLAVIDILLLNKELGYFEKNWITLSVARKGGLESLEHTINKNGRKARLIETTNLEQLQQPARTDTQVTNRKAEHLGPKRPSYEQIKGMASINLIVTTLIATVSFAAGFTMPGGYRSDGPDQGMAILSRKLAFRVFVITNALAFCLSSTSMFLHYCKSFVEKLDTIASYTYMTTLLTSHAITAMVIAFVSGTYAALVDSPGLAKAVVSIGCSSFGLQGNWIVDVRHIFRKGNPCADGLADLAHTVTDGVSYYDDPPTPLLPLLMEDREGIGVLRV